MRRIHRVGQGSRAGVSWCARASGWAVLSGCASLAHAVPALSVEASATRTLSLSEGAEVDATGWAWTFGAGLTGHTDAVRTGAMGAAPEGERARPASGDSAAAHSASGDSAAAHSAALPCTWTLLCAWERHARDAALARAHRAWRAERRAERPR
jgi:hypothetical protein